MRSASGLNLSVRAALILALSIFGLALGPAVSGAQRTTVPPGASEGDQYFEVIPDGTGNSSPDGSKGAEDAVADGVLTPQQLAELRELGPDGEAVARAAAQTAPRVGGKKAGSSSGSGGSDGDGNGALVAGEVRPPEDGLGGLFPWILILIPLVAIAVAARRRVGGANG